MPDWRSRRRQNVADHAGLLPALQDEKQETTGSLPDGSITRRRRRFLPVVVPGSDPLGSLARAILGDTTLPTEVRESAGAAAWLVRALDEAAPGGAVLVVDGLEELFMLCGEAGNRSQFASAVAQISTGHNHLVILTARLGWSTSLATLEALDGVVKRFEVQVPPLTGPAMLDAVASPAARVGLTFDERLAETIARDFLHEPTVLLQVALTTLWQRRVGTRVTWQAYADMGRGRSLVCNHAEALGIAAGSANEPLMRSIMLAFVERGTLPGQIRTLRVERERLLQAADSGAVSDAVERLVSGKLLRSSTSTTGIVRYEWLHDVLKDAVPVVGTWLHEQELDQARAEAASERARADREAGLKKKARWRAWAFAVAAALAVFLMLVTLRQLSLREVLLLASASDRVAAVNPDLALALGAHALQRSPDSAAAAGAVYKVYFEYPTRRVSHPPAAGYVPAAVTAVAVIRDGRFAVTGDTGGALTSLDLQTDERRLLARVAPERGAISSLAITPAGDLVIVGTDKGTVELFDRATGTSLGVWTHHEAGHSVHAVAFSSDGQFAASGSADDTVWVSRRNGHGLGTWRQLDAGSQGHRTSVRALAFGSDRPLLFSGEASGKVIAWNAESSQFVGSRVVWQLDPKAAAQADLRSLVAAPNGCALLAGGNDGTVLLIDIRTAIPEAAVLLPPACPTSPFVSRTASVPDSGGITALAFAPDGRYAVSRSRSGTATLWRASPEALEHVKTFAGHLSRVESVAFPNGEFFLSGNADGSVRAWSLDAALEDGHFTIGSPRAEEAAGAARGPVERVGFSEDSGSLFAAAHLLNKVTVARWDIDTAALTELFSTDYVGTVPPTFDSRGARALVGSSPGLAVRSLSNPAQASATYRDADAVAATLNGQLAAWITDGDWRLMAANVGSPAPPRRITTLTDRPVDERKQPLFVMAGSADQRWLAVGTQSGRLLLFDARGDSGTPRVVAPLHSDRITALAFHPDGDRIASGFADGTVILLNLAGREIGRLRGHTNEVTALAFSPDGVLLLSAAMGADGLLLWHVESRLIVHAFPQQNGIRSVAISPDGRRAVTGSSDGVVRAWKLPSLNSRGLLESVRDKRRVRELTSAERAEFGLTDGFESLHRVFDFLNLERLLR